MIEKMWKAYISYCQVCKNRFDEEDEVIVFTRYKIKKSKSYGFPEAIPNSGLIHISCLGGEKREEFI